jgi:2-iminobutanoate/2-iminopropanoate deaminase
MHFVATSDAPKAIGPYSQAVIHHGILYASGQIPLDPATGELVTGDFATQARRVLDNIGAVLQAGGSSFDRVLKATVYVADLANFQTLNAIYAEYFGEHKPARSTVQAAALPKGATVEIDVIALAG